MKKGIKAVLLLLVIALLAGMTACAPPEPDKDGEKVLQSSVETDIWSGISWLYFRVHGEKELHVCYNGDENIAMAYSLEGYRNEHD